MGTRKAKTKSEDIVISAPRFGLITLGIIGTAPYVQNKFSAKAKRMIQETQEKGSQSKSRKKRVARDFDADYEGAMHIAEEGWRGIPASAFRAAMIGACRATGFKMTHAKMSVFVMPDGLDAEDGTPLVKITRGEPEKNLQSVRNATGVVDLRMRPMWREWEADVRIRFDEDQFSAADVTNLLMRAGQQIGVGEGRPASKSSCGCGYGTFTLREE